MFSFCFWVCSLNLTLNSSEFSSYSFFAPPTTSLTSLQIERIWFHHLIILSKRLIFLSLSSFFKLENMFLFKMVFDDGDIVILLCLHLLESCFILISEPHVSSPLRLLPLSLLILESFHDILVEFLLLSNFTLDHLNLFTGLVDLVVRHVDGSEDIRFLLFFVRILGFWTFVLGINGLCQSIFPTHYFVTF